MAGMVSEGPRRQSQATTARAGLAGWAPRVRSSAPLAVPRTGGRQYAPRPVGPLPRRDRRPATSSASLRMASLASGYVLGCRSYTGSRRMHLLDAIFSHEGRRAPPADRERQQSGLPLPHSVPVSPGPPCRARSAPDRRRYDRRAHGQRRRLGRRRKRQRAEGTITSSSRVAWSLRANRSGLVCLDQQATREHDATCGGPEPLAVRGRTSAAYSPGGTSHLPELFRSRSIST